MVSAAGGGEGTSGDAEVRDLLGLYALDALEAADQARVEALLARSPGARAELEDLRLAASALGSGVPQIAPPPGLEARVLERVRREGGGTRTPPAPARRPRTRPSPPRRRRGLSGFAFGLAGASLAAVALLAVRVSRLGGEAAEAARQRDAVVAALADPASRTVVLRSPDGNAALGRAVIRPGGSVLLAHSMGRSPSDRVWQAWAIRGGVPVPLETFDGGYRVVRVPEGTVAVAISEEPPGGSRTPTTVRAVGAI